MSKCAADERQTARQASESLCQSQPVNREDWPTAPATVPSPPFAAKSEQRIQLAAASEPYSTVPATAATHTESVLFQWSHSSRQVGSILLHAHLLRFRKCSLGSVSSTSFVLYTLPSFFGVSC